MDQSPERKLAAIMFTDIVGYTDLMGKNESEAFELINTQRDLIKPIINSLLFYVGFYLCFVRRK